MKEKYTWLGPDDERRNMPDREIFDRYIDLNESCLIGQKRSKVMDMCYINIDTFSLRD